MMVGLEKASPGAGNYIEVLTNRPTKNRGREKQHYQAGGFVLLKLNDLV
jgi:hypothetical protein